MTLPSTIRSIGIPLFENATPVFELEQLMTEKVRLEFISRGKYRVTPDAPGADAVLLGAVVSSTDAAAVFAHFPVALLGSGTPGSASVQSAEPPPVAPES